MNARCDRCVFWELDNRYNNVEGSGICRRYPPQVGTDNGGDAVFPLTFDCDWCGEFKPVATVVDSSPGASRSD
jgi:hypothetical protein